MLSDPRSDEVRSDELPREIELTSGKWRVYCAVRFDGADDDTIARRLGVSKNTVKTQMRCILRKAGVANRAALLADELNGRVHFVRSGASRYQADR